MKYYLAFRKINYKIYLCADTWMCHTLGVGELRSEYQGRSRVTSFTQETGEKIQYKSRIGCKPNLQRYVQDALGFLTHFPFFFISLRSNE